MAMQIDDKLKNSMSKTKTKKSVGEFISELFNSRTQAHIFHLNTNSFAAHKALNEYYDGIVGLADTIAEAYQGKYGIIKGYAKSVSFVETGKPVDYLCGILDCVVGCRYDTFSREDTNLQNEIDNVVTLLNETIYKLTFLS
jgi:hypothetical protein